MDIRPLASVKSIAHQPFRALHALVEFFAPWQKENPGSPQERLHPGTPSSPGLHALDAARQFGHPTQDGPISAQAYWVTNATARRPHPRVRNTAVAAANQETQPAIRPLRVIRAIDTQIPPNASGRMVISGRMADVCAELERLSDAVQA